MADKAQMHARQAKLSHDRLLDVLSYDPETGIFLWKKRISIRIVVGKVAGRLDRNGHIQITIDGIRWMAHRLAWFYVHSVWPDDEIDHRDLKKSNNALINLRQSTRLQNMCNTPKPINNTSGYKGVYFDKRCQKWVAQIHAKGRHYWLGSFDDLKDAHAAYVDGSKQKHGEFGRAA